MHKRLAIGVAFITLLSATSVLAATMNEAVIAKFAEVEQQYQLPQGILAKIAKIESNGNVQALNGSTQAGGLFQWIPRYWYDAASKVYPPGSGALNPQSRFNPFIATEVTGYSLRHVKNVVGPLIQAANADLSVGLYMGHFLGAGGASKFFAIMKANPQGSASQYFPKEAQYNSSVFSGRTIAGVYNFFASKMQAPGISGVSNYDGSYTGPMTGRIMDASGNTALQQSYTAIPPAAPYRTYPTTFNAAQDSSYANTNLPPQTPNTTPPPSSPGPGSSSVVFPPASLIIAQPSVVTKGDVVVVSWTSVGMNTSTQCEITSDGGTQTARSNEGTLYVDTSTMSSIVTFTQRCTSKAGDLIEKTASVTLR